MLYEAAHVCQNKKRKGQFFLYDFRIALELEWEYAACNNYDDNGFTKQLSKSKKGKPNTYGLKYFNSNDSEFINSSNDNRVLIKGSSYDDYIQCKAKLSYNSEYRSATTGFRIVRTFLGRKRNND